MRAVKGSLGRSLKGMYMKPATLIGRAQLGHPTHPFKVTGHCGLAWDKARLGAPGLGG